MCVKRLRFPAQSFKYTKLMMVDIVQTFTRICYADIFKPLFTQSNSNRVVKQ